MNHSSFDGCLANLFIHKPQPHKVPPTDTRCVCHLLCRRSNVILARHLQQVRSASTSIRDGNCTVAFSDHHLLSSCSNHHIKGPVAITSSCAIWFWSCAPRFGRSRFKIDFHNDVCLTGFHLSSCTIWSPLTANWEQVTRLNCRQSQEH